VRAAIRDSAVRHATGVASAVLVLSVVGFVAYLLISRSTDLSGALGRDELLYAACQVLPYGLVGAVLVARRPDLPFGWLLALAALSLVVMLPVVGLSYRALDSGSGGQLATWGLGLGGLAFVPIALEGVVNVRFPSGRPTGRLGRLLDRALVWGTVVVLVGSVFGDSVVRSLYPDGLPAGASRPVDGTPVVTVGNALGVAVPLLVLLGLAAGLGVVVRCVRAEGIERKQLQWRAAGVLVALALFPFAVTETLPEWVNNVAPLLFVVTLIVPVLRYDLWAIDSLIRRSAAHALSSSGGAVDNLVQAAAEMLRLPYVAVHHGERVLAAYGQPTATGPETWPLVDDGRPVGTLAAAPRHGLTALDDRQRQVLATVARLVAGSVRAEALTAELLDARQRLVAAREEERRRLRRDLHDGLGPLLTGLGLNLDAAQATIEQDGERAATYLAQAKDASSRVISDLRGLVQGLRPPAIDELGLAGALRLHTERIARDASLSLDLQVPDGLVLPAAVEVAAFRTVVEAVNNVVRHSGAGRVRVRLDVEDARLCVLVMDDGSRTSAWHPGVGLTGMRERAEELGGTLVAGPSREGGCTRALFPLGALNS